MGIVTVHIDKNGNETESIKLTTPFEIAVHTHRSQSFLPWYVAVPFIFLLLIASALLNN